MRAYSYIRFSTPEQRIGDSLRRQLEASRQYAEQHGLELDDSLRDEGRSAFKGDHRRFGALGRFLARVENGSVPPGSLLIVENLDRLSRESIHEALQQFLSLLSAGIEIVTLSDGRRYDSSSVNSFTDLVISLSVMARAHNESARKSELNGAAWANKRKEAAESGKPMTALCPWWLQLREDRSGFDIIPEYAEIVRKMFADTIKGVGRRTIAISLNELDIKPRRWGTRQAKRWHTSLITKTLSNRAVLGEFVSTRGDTIQGYYPAIIDESVFYQAQQAAASRRISGGKRGKAFSNLLTGMCKCIECDGTVRYQNKGNGGKYLFCDNQHMNAGCGNRKRWHYDHIEATALLVLAEVIDWTAIYGNGDSKKSELEQALATEQAKLAQAELIRDRYQSRFEDPDNEMSDAVLAALTSRHNIAIESVSSIKNIIKKYENQLAAYVPAEKHVDNLYYAFGKLGVDGTYEDRAHVNSLLRQSGLELWFGPDAIVWRVGNQKGVLIDGNRDDEVREAVMLAKAIANTEYAIDEMKRTVDEAERQRLNKR